MSWQAGDAGPFQRSWSQLSSAQRQAAAEVGMEAADFLASAGVAESSLMIAADDAEEIARLHHLSVELAAAGVGGAGRVMAGDHEQDHGDAVDSGGGGGGDDGDDATASEIARLHHLSVQLARVEGSGSAAAASQASDSPPVPRKLELVPATDSVRSLEAFGSNVNAPQTPLSPLSALLLSPIGSRSPAAVQTPPDLNLQAAAADTDGTPVRAAASTAATGEGAAESAESAEPPVTTDELRDKLEGWLSTVDIGEQTGAPNRQTRARAA
eukprot:COSAG01_NODE_915_length_12761_cov_33.161507_3_plen_269_part_00